jgi:rubrerythrin
MSDSIQIYFDEDGVARAYDDTYDITIHCETEEEYNDAMQMLERASETTTWLGDFSPYTCQHCGFHVDSKTKYCPDCGRRETNYE